MQLSAVLLARVLAFFDINDLNPRGRLFFPDLVPLIVERFRFSTYPQKPEDFDEQKGIVFSGGYISGTTVDKLTVWSDGAGFDVRSSTDEAKEIIHDTFQWLKSVVDLNYTERSIIRWGYLSQLTFYSDIDLLKLNPAVEKLCNRISEHLGSDHKSYEFRPVNLGLTFDRYMNPWTMAPFGIQRRAGSPFEDNKYFSEAPLPTATHLEFLQALEEDLRAQL